jgi:hypothetical protein
MLRYRADCTGTAVSARASIVLTVSWYARDGIRLAAVHRS